MFLLNMLLPLSLILRSFFRVTSVPFPVMFHVMYVVCLVVRSMLRSNVWKLKLLRLREILLFCRVKTICHHLNLLFLSTTRSHSCFATLLLEMHDNVPGVHPFLLWLVITPARVRLQRLRFINLQNVNRQPFVNLSTLVRHLRQYDITLYVNHTKFAY